jgi:sigma-E factor negative regulatory protein RseA
VVKNFENSSVESRLVKDTMKHANDPLFYAQQLSALADNELGAEQTAAVVQQCGQDSSLMHTWASYHTIGDLLRANALDTHTRDLRDLQNPAPVAQSITLTQPAAAANDSVFRWKMVAGVAALAAVGSVLWAIVGAPSGLGGVQLAQQNGGQSAAVAAASSSAVAANDNVQVMIRDPRLDELLAAHKQFGGASALQQPAGFLRNATFNPSGR